MPKVAVIGGGLAGSSAAIRLAHAGFHVTLFEKEKASHHKVCGEYLSGEALPLLEELGLDIWRLGAVTMTQLRLHGPRRKGSCSLPVPAVGLSRKVLDEALLDKAQSIGVEVLKGLLVKSVRSENSVHVLSCARGEESFSHVLVASGKHDSKFISLRDSKEGEFVGAKMHLRLTTKSPSSVELFLFADGYAGLSTVENGVVNLAYVLRKDMAKQVGTDWTKHQDFLSRSNGFLKKYLREGAALFPRPVTVATLPYGYLRSESTPEGLYYLGDQMVCIPSLTGEGMAMALYSAKVAANALLKNQGSESYHREMRKAFAPQMRVAYRLHRLFRYPKALELLFPLISYYPQPVERLFRQTRLQTRLLAFN